MDTRFSQPYLVFRVKVSHETHKTIYTCFYERFTELSGTVAATFVSFCIIHLPFPICVFCFFIFILFPFLNWCLTPIFLTHTTFHLVHLKIYVQNILIRAHLSHAPHPPLPVYVIVVIRTVHTVPSSYPTHGLPSNRQTLEQKYMSACLCVMVWPLRWLKIVLIQLQQANSPICIIITHFIIWGNQVISKLLISTQHRCNKSKPLL